MLAAWRAEDFVFEIAEAGFVAAVFELRFDGVHLRVKRDHLLLGRHAVFELVETLPENVDHVREHRRYGVELLAVGFFHTAVTSLYLFRSARMGMAHLLQSSKCL